MCYGRRANGPPGKGGPNPRPKLGSQLNPNNLSFPVIFIILKLQTIVGIDCSKNHKRRKSGPLGQSHFSGVLFVLLGTAKPTV